MVIAKHTWIGRFSTRRVRVGARGTSTTGTVEGTERRPAIIARAVAVGPCTGVGPRDQPAARSVGQLRTGRLGAWESRWNGWAYPVGSCVSAVGRHTSPGPERSSILHYS